MKYCYECGTKLLAKELDGEGIIPFCSNCKRFIFPFFSTAVICIVMNPTKDKILLIKQYGSKNKILVAGYTNKGENVEHTVVREVKEELGLKVIDYQYMRSEYFEKTNTLMLNFVCTVACENLSNINKEIDEAKWFTIEQALSEITPGSLAEKFLINAVNQMK